MGARDTLIAYKESLKDKPKKICQLSLIFGLSISFAIISFALFVVTFISYSHPQVASLMNFHDPSARSVEFPKVAICPASTQEQKVTVTSVKCTYHDVINQHARDHHHVEGVIEYKKIESNIDAIQSHPHVMGIELHDCFDVNYNREKSPVLSREESHSFVSCSVEATGDVRIQPYAFERKSPRRSWASWTHLKRNQSTMVAIQADDVANWGRFYTVLREDEELRVQASNNVVFTIEFSRTKSRRYELVYSHDFWSTVGIVGGILLLHIVTYHLVMHLFSLTRWGRQESDYTFKSSIAENTSVANYGTA